MAKKQNIKDILSETHIKSIEEMSLYISKTQKLCDELTAENARLLTELDKLGVMYKTSVSLNKEYKDLSKYQMSNLDKFSSDLYDAETELTSIKSKWWYKLMTCLNKN